RSIKIQKSGRIISRLCKYLLFINYLLIEKVTLLANLETFLLVPSNEESSPLALTEILSLDTPACSNNLATFLALFSDKRWLYSALPTEAANPFTDTVASGLLLK